MKMLSFIISKLDSRRDIRLTRYSTRIGTSPKRTIQRRQRRRSDTTWNGEAPSESVRIHYLILHGTVAPNSKMRERLLNPSAIS